MLRDGVRDSWLKVLKVIEEAPVWQDGKGKRAVKIKNHNAVMYRYEESIWSSLNHFDHVDSNLNSVGH